MKKLILSAALLLLTTSSAYAAGDTAAKQDDAMKKHCVSMMKDGKMMDGMPKQMTDKCEAMMKDGMAGMNKEAVPSDMAKPATSDTANDQMQGHRNDAK